MGTSQYIDLPFRKLFKSDDTASYGIVNVMIDICDPVAYLYDLALKSHRNNASAVVEYAIPHLICEVKSPPSGSVLDDINCTQALLIVNESAGVYPVKDFFADMSERSVPEIMTECDSFCKVLIIGKDPGNSTGYL